MPDYPTVFYRAPGEDPVPAADPFTHPVTGVVLFGPTADAANDLYALDFYVEPADPRTHTSTPEYSMNPDESLVRMSWDNDLKPINQLYQARLAELRILAKAKLKFTRTFNSVPADEDTYATLVLSHQVRIDSGDTDAGDEYHFLRSDGEWAQRSANSVRSYARNLSKDANTVGLNFETHKAALIVLRDAGDHLGVVEYDITTGWPA